MLPRAVICFASGAFFLSYCDYFFLEHNVISYNLPVEGHIQPYWVAVQNGFSCILVVLLSHLIQYIIVQQRNHQLQQQQEQVQQQQQTQSSSSTSKNNLDNLDNLNNLNNDNNSVVSTIKATSTILKHTSSSSNNNNNFETITSTTSTMISSSSSSSSSTTTTSSTTILNQVNAGNFVDSASALSSSTSSSSSSSNATIQYFLPPVSLVTMILSALNLAMVWKVCAMVVMPYPYHFTLCCALVLWWCLCTRFIFNEIKQNYTKAAPTLTGHEYKEQYSIWKQWYIWFHAVLVFLCLAGDFFSLSMGNFTYLHPSGEENQHFIMGIIPIWVPAVYLHTSTSAWLLSIKVQQYL